MKKICMRIGVAMIIGALIMIIALWPLMLSATRKPVDIFVDGVEKEDDIKTGLPIDTDMYVLLECFGTEEITNNKNAVKDVYYYYILPVFVGEEDTYYVAMKVDADDENLSDCEKIANETISYLLGEIDYMGTQSVHLSGYLEKLDKEKFGYMKEWFTESQYFASDSEVDKYVLPYVFTFEKRNFVTGTAMVMAGLFVGGILLIVIGLICGRKYAARRKQLVSQQGRMININGVPYDVSRMTDIDSLIYSGKLEKAKAKLIVEYRGDPAQAAQIVDNWVQITGLM